MEFLCSWDSCLVGWMADQIPTVLIRLVFYSIPVEIKVSTTRLRLNINLTLRLINRSELLDAHLRLLFKAF